MPTPTLLLKPGASEDANGAMTPTITGTVDVVSGVYGPAWDLAGGGYLSFADAGRVSAAQGTIVFRITTPILSDVAYLYEGTTGANVARVVLTSTRGLTTRFGGVSRASGFVVPTGSLQNIAATWQASGHQAWLNGSAGTAFADTPPATINTTIRIGANIDGNFKFPGVLESVLVFDEVLGADDIATISTYSGAWTMGMLNPVASYDYAAYRNALVL